MTKSSINIQPVKANSESHNTRKTELDYNFKELEKNNESSIKETIEKRRKKVEQYCKTKSGRAMNKNATPIREAVVNLEAHHSMDDLKKLSFRIKEKFGVDVFQIHIHRDEGKAKNDLNYHAHLLIDWQDKSTGKMKRHGRFAMSQLQTLVADQLVMERGELKVNSNRERLEPIEYKRVKEEEKLKKLQLQVEQLEQKKNRVAEGNQATRNRIKKAEKEQEAFKGISKQRSEELARKGIQFNWTSVKKEADALSGAIKLQQEWINQQKQQIEEIQSSAELAFTDKKRLDWLREDSKLRGAIHGIKQKIQDIGKKINDLENGSEKAR